jgi:hypothetical protein
MERRGYIIPGVNKFLPNELYHIEELKFIQLPDKDNTIKIYNEINGMASVIYVKLHGSYGWLSYDSKKTAMIIGKNKPEDIEKEPLLKEYWKLFNDAIAQGNKKILIIGYGFGDKHINKILEDGVKNHDLQIYIINNELPNKFTERSIMHPSGVLWKGVKGYFPYLLKDICPLGGQETSYFREIKNALLN